MTRFPDVVGRFVAVVVAGTLLVPASAMAQCSEPGDPTAGTVYPECDTRPPTAQFDIAAYGSHAGEQWIFQSHSAANPDRKLAREEWDFDGDGKYDSTGREAKHAYSAPGDYQVTLHVVDDHGGDASTSKTVSVRPPVVTGLVLEVDHTDLVWPHTVTLRVRLQPEGSRLAQGDQIYIRGVPPRDDGTNLQDTGATATLNPDGTYGASIRPIGNTIFTAEVTTSLTGRLMSAPVTVYVDWVGQIGWGPLGGGRYEAGFVIRPAWPAARLERQLYYFYYHPRGARYAVRVAHGRAFISRSGHIAGYKRFRLRHRAHRRDQMAFCIRGAGSDGWGRPFSKSVCGVRRVRW